MRDKDLYAAILGVRAPWSVGEVQLRPATQEVEVFIQHDGSASLCCPQCGQACGRYDTRRRSWRHLDTCQFHTVLTADVPRVSCPEHGVLQLNVPWAERGSRFTALFESLAIDWLRESNLTAVARRLRVSWEELDGIQRRAVQRGLARRAVEPISKLGVDETSFQKRHEYVTVVSDLDRGRLLYVADDRDQASLEGFYRGLTAAQREAIEAVDMDMWQPYLKAMRAQLPGWESKVCFDRFHVAQHLGEAVSAVRKAEHCERLAAGDRRLQRTRFLWLMGPARRAQLDAERRREFDALRGSTLQVARAWAIKETARALWGYVQRGWASAAGNAGLAGRSAPDWNRSARSRAWSRSICGACSTPSCRASPTPPPRASTRRSSA